MIIPGFRMINLLGSNQTLGIKRNISHTDNYMKKASLKIKLQLLFNHVHSTPPYQNQGNIGKLEILKQNKKTSNVTIDDDKIIK